MNPDLSLTKLEMQGIEGKAKETRTKFFEVKDLTLLQFLEHEIVQEYEKSIRCIFDRNWELANKEKPNFHIISMSAILN